MKQPIKIKKQNAPMLTPIKETPQYDVVKNEKL
jgi:hypothetical protein